jgi:sorbitol-specific phosphotransferase system component IIA
LREQQGGGKSRNATTDNGDSVGWIGHARWTIAIVGEVANFKAVETAHCVAFAFSHEGTKTRTKCG